MPRGAFGVCDLSIGRGCSQCHNLCLHSNLDIRSAELLEKLDVLHGKATHSEVWCIKLVSAAYEEMPHFFSVLPLIARTCCSAVPTAGMDWFLGPRTQFCRESCRIRKFRKNWRPAFLLMVGSLTWFGFYAAQQQLEGHRGDWIWVAGLLARTVHSISKPASRVAHLTV